MHCSLRALALLTTFSLTTLDGAQSTRRTRDTVAIGITVTPIRTDSAGALQLELTIPRVRDSAFTLQLPNEWAGRASLFHNIVSLEAVSPGASLSPTDDSSRVRVHAQTGVPLTIRWRLNKTPPSTSAPDAHNHSVIGRDWAQLVGQDALVLPVYADSSPVRIQFTFKDIVGGAAIATSFGSPRAGDSTVVALGMLNDFQYAVYTFAINKGSVRTYHAPVPGGQLTLLVRGNFRIADSVLQHSVQQVIAMERKFWGGKSPANYLVTIGVASRGTLAGVRLHNAFVADIDSTRTMDTGVTMLFAHELMHEWIGGLIHQTEDVPDGSIAWFTEGFTDYMAHRLMWQSGLVSDSAYVEIINGTIAAHALSSARDSLWKSVVEGHWRDSDIQREPYLRGELLAMQLDRQSRNTPIKTSNSSLEKALMALSTDKKYLSPGISESDLRTHLSRAAGRFANDAITKALAGGEINLPANTFGACAESRTQQRGRWDPGFNVDSSIKARKVFGVRADGPAAAAGLRDGMLISSTNIWYNDPSKTLSLGVKFADSTKTISYQPVSPNTIEVQRFQFTMRPCKL